MSQLYEQLNELVSANIPHIYLKAYETERALRLIKDVTSELSIDNIYLWSFAAGICKIGSNEHDVCSANMLLQFIDKIKGKAVIVLKDAEIVFNDTESLLVLQEIISRIKKGLVPLTIVSISTLTFIPDGIEKDTYIVNIPLPTKDEIKDLINNYSKMTGIHLSQGMRIQLASGFNGLTEDEIISLLNRTIARAMGNKSHIGVASLNMIIKQKKQVIQKSGIVEFIDERIGIDAVGGLTRLKRWLKDRKSIFDDLEKAKENGLKPPKGILMFGTPGSGKSLTAKVVATYYNLPLLRVDMGLIYGQKSPEEAVSKVTALADSIAPCVLFIDELEKALAGSEAGAADPTAIKVLGILLTWMQERTAPVFIVATANDISMIRPETYRDGRIDEKFFLGFLDDTEQIKQIIDIHLKLRLKDNCETLVKKLDYKLIHRKMEQKVSYYGGDKKAGYSGANMEALVAKVLEERYFRGKDFIETKDFVRALETVRPQHGLNISTMLYRAKEMDAITA